MKDKAHLLRLQSISLQFVLFVLFTPQMLIDSIALSKRI